jgi:hypothetical protein
VGVLGWCARVPGLESSTPKVGGARKRADVARVRALQVLVEAARLVWEQRPGSDVKIDDITACVAFF